MIPAHFFVGPETAPHLAFVMHGVLGSGHNLRSMAKKLSDARPDYRFVLIDLRYHGKSVGAPPPHHLEACADDLIDLAQHLGRAPRAVIGHSLGGKVALAYAKRQESPLSGYRTSTPLTQGALAQVWTLDSDPGAQQPGSNHQVYQVVRALITHPGPFAARDDAVAAIVSTGLSTGLAHWLATSMDRKPDGYHFRFEMDHIVELLKDYFSLDYWPYLEHIAERGLSAPVSYELLVAENSDRWSGSMKERAATLHAEPGDPRHGRIRVHHLPDAGHWVHVDNPQGLHQILVDHLI